MLRLQAIGQVLADTGMKAQIPTKSANSSEMTVYSIWP